MSRENLLSIESTVASQRLNAAAELYGEDGESNAFFAIRGKGDWDPLPWVLILFVKSLDGYLICMGIQVLTPSKSVHIRSARDINRAAV